MTRRILFSLLVMAFPLMGYSQSTLNFPKLFSAAELPNTGFAIVNPGSTAATVTFTLYSATGATVSSKTYSAADGITAGGQFAKSGNEIFSTLGSGGWVQATSTASGLTGFWINYAGDLSYLDGADGAAAVTTGVFPLVAGQTQINVANLAAASNEVHFHIHANDGSEIATAATQNIAAKGVYSAQVTDLFPGVNMANASYVRVIALGGDITGTSFVRGYLVPVESAVVNMSDGLTTSTEANFPHMANGILTGLNYSTVVDVVNLAQASQTVTITFTPDTGTPVSVQRTLAQFAAVRETATSLFNLPSTFVGGYVRITGTGPLTGFAAFADSVGGQMAVVPVGTAKTEMLFAHIADGSPWQTGMAFLNTSSTTANVEISAMKPDGTLYGSKTISIQGGKRSVDVIHGWISQVAGNNGGFVFVRSNVALYGIELFYTENGQVLSNVAAGGLAAGVTYNPPAPAAPLTLTSATPTTVARGGTMTLVGTGFSTTAASNTVRFTSATGTVDATATTATATSLTVTVPATAISGPVLVRVGSQQSTSVLISVTATTTSQLSTITDVTAGLTTSNVDIYVPSTSSAQNVLSLGLAEPDSLAFFLGGDTVEIAAGATKDMLVTLTSGFTENNGTTLRVSGTGVTVSNATFLSVGGAPALLVRLQVAASAAVGPRNIVVANNSLDTTVFTGGLYIK